MPSEELLAGNNRENGDTEALESLRDSLGASPFVFFIWSGGVVMMLPLFTLFSVILLVSET